MTKKYFGLEKQQISTIFRLVIWLTIILIVGKLCGAPYDWFAAISPATSVYFGIRLGYWGCFFGQKIILLLMKLNGQKIDV